MRLLLNFGTAATLLAATCLGTPAIAAPGAPTTMNDTDPDTRLIHELLQAYTGSVSTGNRERFEQLLLDTSIPFYGVRGPQPADLSLKAVQSYAGFRQSVFESGRKYAQRFYDVHIERDGDLAQVSLKFETRLVDAGGGGQGWKVLHLLKVGGTQWKIASEFYTVGPLPSP